MSSFIYKFLMLALLTLLTPGFSTLDQNTTPETTAIEPQSHVQNTAPDTVLDTASDTESETTAIEPLPYVQGEGITKEEMDSGYNAYGRIDIKGEWDSRVVASFIFWQALEENLCLARSDIRSANAWHQNQVYYNMNFDYIPGFKAGIGHSLSNHDNWDFFVRYTGLHLKNKVSYNFNDYVTVPSFYASYSGIYISAAKARWRLNFDMADFEMARSFYLGTRLITRPFVGLKGGYIKQKYRNTITDYNANIGTYYPFYNGEVESWKLGARTGCDLSWFISRSFRVEANAALDLLYANFKSNFTNYLYQGTASNVYTLTGNKNSDLIQPAFETSLGFGWGSYLANDRLHFDFSASYEFQVYLQENQFLFEQVKVDMGGLYLHGLTANARLDF